VQDSDPVMAFDGRQSAAAAEIQRGVCRAMRALGHSVVTELSLANDRRADVVGLSPSGDIWIVEIKSCLLDFQTWQMDRIPSPLRPALFCGVSRLPLPRDPSGCGADARRPVWRASGAGTGRGALRRDTAQGDDANLRPRRGAETPASPPSPRPRLQLRTLKGYFGARLARMR